MHIRNAVLFIAIVVFSTALAPRAMAGQTIVQRLHDLMTREKTDPTKTLQAPFIKPEDMKTPTADAMGLPYDPYFENHNKGNLAEPHRDEDQVGEWLTGTVSDALNLTVKGYDAHMEALGKVLNSDAIGGYKRFISDSHILDRMTANNARVHGFVEDKPILLNEGVVDDRYHWLYDVDATITFLNGDKEDYQIDADRAGTFSYRLIIRAQLGRVAEQLQGEQTDQAKNGSGQGLVVESWEVRKNPVARKDN